MRYYATLGYTPGVLVDVKDVPRPTRVTVFHGNENARQRQALVQGKAILEGLGLAAEFIGIGQPWNFESCFRAICQGHTKAGSPSLVAVNASGGTEVMNSAMTLFALLAGCQCRYVDRRTWKSVAVDFGTVLKALSLDGTRRQMLHEALQGGGIVALAELPQRLGVSASAISQQLSALKADGLVATVHQDSARGKAVEAAPQLWPLVEFRAKNGSKA